MSTHEYSAAVQDFRRARQRAGLEKLLARWTGKSLDLLSYDQVRERLRLHNRINRGLQEIPLNAIVGSVGRYRDFTRAFLPRHDSDESRWAGVKVAQLAHGLPPISVYQVGEAYFVLDGNHRVSVARQLGSETIEAYVCELKTKAPLDPDDRPDDLIVKAEYADFLAKTQIDELRPALDLTLTAPGKYPLLLEHIECHRYYMGVEQSREIPYEEAVLHWADEVYDPTVRLIREAGLCHDFPKRTSADLYVWASEHRAEVEAQMGWNVSTAATVADIADQFGRYRPARLVSRALSAVLPASRDKSADHGRWRKLRLQAVGEHAFVETLLLPVTGSEPGWQALDQAILVAQRESSHIYGIFAVAEKVERDTLLTQALKTEFDRRCRDGNIPGELIIEEGDLEKLIARRGRWADVMVLNTASTSVGTEGLKEPVYRRVVRRASGPILVVPGSPSPLNSLLLAYDDRPASDEALYVSTYLGGRWKIPVTVLSVGDLESKAVTKAGEYLTQAGVAAELVIGQGGCDLIVMGSPSLSPMHELVLGSTVKELLRSSELPLLLCR
jgi:nucleotide-binding universal stress UspA family protein